MCAALKCLPLDLLGLQGEGKQKLGRRVDVCNLKRSQDLDKVATETASSSL